MPDRHRLGALFPKAAESSKSLGFKLISLDIKAMHTRVRFDGKPDFANLAGYIQGGYLSAMLDDTMGMIATIKAGARGFPSTVDLHVHFLRPVKIGPIEVSACVRNIGRRVIFTQADLYDHRGKESARASASLSVNPALLPNGSRST